MTGYCEHGSEHLGLITGGEFVGQMCEYKLLKKNADGATCGTGTVEMRQNYCSCKLLQQ